MEKASSAKSLVTPQQISPVASPLNVQATPPTLLQEDDGIRKSGQLTAISIPNSKGKKTYYAVLSERALELHESEKAQRKKKNCKYIVDLSRCFNVSQQNCPKTKWVCVSVMMPDETIALRGETNNDSAEWYCAILSAIISARALHLGRPVFANEFFECVWDVSVIGNPKLRKPVPSPDNSPNICTKIPEISGKKRLCFYPHTIVLCKIGIEPAHNGLPKSGIPPFRLTDFVEFSRQFIASFGFQEKYFIMRIGRSAPMGQCEVWVQCDSEEVASEVNNKLMDIIRRETEKKCNALMALGSIGGPGGSVAKSSSYISRHHHSSSSQSGASSATTFSTHRQNISNQQTSPPCSPPSPSPSQSTLCPPGKAFESQHELSLAPIAEGAETRGEPPAQRKVSAQHHHRLSQSAREKRMELRECKAKVDSLEEDQQLLGLYYQQMAANPTSHGVGGSGNLNSTVILNNTVTARWRKKASTGSFGMGSNCRRGSANSLVSAATTYRKCYDNSESSDDSSIESSEARSGRRHGGGGIELGDDHRNKSFSMDANLIRQLNAPSAFLDLYKHRDSLASHTASSSSVSGGGAEEETEDSGGTLRLGVNCNGNSRSSLNLLIHQQQPQGFLVEALVECHTIEGAEMDPEGSGNTLVGTEGIICAGAAGIDISVIRRLNEQRSRKSSAQRESLSDANTDLADANRKRSASSNLAHQRRPDNRSRSSTVGGAQHHHDPLSSRVGPQKAIDTGNSSSENASTASSSMAVESLGGPSTADEDQEYTLMDKASCSSGSFSHLAVPPSHWDKDPTMNPDNQEICSYTSDSGDSCYSSMVNGNLNPRAFSFSSDIARLPPGGGCGPRTMSSSMATRCLMAHGAKDGGQRHFTPQQQHQHHHFCPPVSPPNNANNMNDGTSSSGSRFSMETSLITPLEEEERQVSFADERTRINDGSARRMVPGESPKCGSPVTMPAFLQQPKEDLRKRAFSLGSRSWITKPFRKLSSTTNNGNALPTNSNHPSIGGSCRHRASASRSGSSSMVSSIHADDCECHPAVQAHVPACIGVLSSRQPSSSSFASSTRHTRSDSIGSNHSTTLPHGITQKLFSANLRKKPPSEEQLRSDDLVELEFISNSTLLTGKSYLSTDPDAIRSPLSCRTRTNSCDDHAQNHRGVRNSQSLRGSFCDGEVSSPSLGGIDSTNQQSRLLSKYTEDSYVDDRNMRPSESFIESFIRAHNSGGSGSKAPSLKRIDLTLPQHHKTVTTPKQQQGGGSKPMSPTGFALQEVCCFIAPAEREKINALTSKDTVSMHSQKTDRSYFENIAEENLSGRTSRSSSRSSHQEKQNISVQKYTTEDEYVLTEPSPQK